MSIYFATSCRKPDVQVDQHVTTRSVSQALIHVKNIFT
ncbi:hypothetical protein MIZ03_3066 [Rhodoferax lithotrophicus]|uniref:Uncharacterized protein n=1 Tax=Rhodoferax lithotrophicus TaxID=2798804 RepID=A0ABM7MQ04_9BURK|nr:hypothetical protein MIZ03_3066 [Rhodoferax sp. MIZ03]